MPPPAAIRILPNGEEYVRWKDINAELERMQSPIHFYWGPSRQNDPEKCGTGCKNAYKIQKLCIPYHV